MMTRELSDNRSMRTLVASTYKYACFESTSSHSSTIMTDTSVLIVCLPLNLLVRDLTATFRQEQVHQALL